MRKSILRNFIILFSLFATAEISKAQNPQIYGSTGFGGKYNEGFLFQLKDAKASSTAYYRKVTHPVSDFIEYREKLYGISAMDEDFGGFAHGSFRLCKAENAASPLIGLQRRSAISKIATLGFEYGTHDGFSFEGDLMAFSHSGWNIGIYNIETDSLVYTYTNKAVTFCRAIPLLLNQKVYYGTKSGNDFYFNELDFNTGIVRNIFSCPKTEIRDISGAILPFGNHLYIMAQALDGLKNTQFIYRVDISDGSRTLLAKIACENYQGSNSKFVQVNDWFYNVTTTGGSSNKGSLFRINPSTNTFEILYNFGTGINLPFNGLVEYNGDLFGTTMKKGQDSTIAVFRFNIQTKTISSIKEIQNAEAREHLIDGVFKFQNKLYVYGAKSGKSKVGMFEQIDANGASLSVYDDFQHQLVGFGSNLPELSNEKFVGVSDSSFYKCEAAGDTLHLWDELSDTSIYFGTHSQIVVDNVLYGLYYLTGEVGGTLLVSYDIASKKLKKEKELPGFGTYNEAKMLYKNGRLYFGVEVDFKTKLLEYSIQTGDTATYMIGNNECLDYSFNSCVIGNDLFFVSYEECDSIRKIVKFSLDSHLSTEFPVPSMYNPKFVTGNVAAANGIFYTVVDAYDGSPSSVLSFNPANGEFQNFDLGDSLSVKSNLLNHQNSIHVLVRGTTATRMAKIGGSVELVDLVDLPVSGYYKLGTNSAGTNEISELNGNQKGLFSFPNPCHDYFDLNLNGTKAKSYKIYNVLGQAVKSDVLSGNRINISNLEVGVYTCVLDGDENLSVKLVKE